MTTLSVNTLYQSHRPKNILLTVLSTRRNIIAEFYIDPIVTQFSSNFIFCKNKILPTSVMSMRQQKSHLQHLSYRKCISISDPVYENRCCASRCGLFHSLFKRLLAQASESMPCVVVRWVRKRKELSAENEIRLPHRIQTRSARLGLLTTILGNIVLFKKNYFIYRNWLEYCYNTGFLIYIIMFLFSSIDKKTSYGWCWRPGFGLHETILKPITMQYLITFTIF